MAKHIQIIGKTLHKHEKSGGIKMGGGSWTINLDEVGGAEVDAVEYSTPKALWKIDYETAQEKGFVRIMGGERKLVVPKKHWTQEALQPNGASRDVPDLPSEAELVEGRKREGKRDVRIQGKSVKIYKVMKICSSHRLDLPYDSPCNRDHGHNYKIEVWLEGVPSSYNDMVMDFTYVKNIVNELDHQNLNDFIGARTTAENICVWISNRIRHEHIQFTTSEATLDHVRVRVWETDTCYAEHVS